MPAFGLAEDTQLRDRHVATGNRMFQQTLVRCGDADDSVRLKQIAVVLNAAFQAPVLFDQNEGQVELRRSPVQRQGANGEP